MENISKSKQKQLIINSAVKEYASLPMLDRSIAKVSRKYGINKKTLKHYLDLQGIEINRHNNSCNFRYDFFKKIDTEEKAYWLGFMYADGCVDAKGNGVLLQISLDDIDHLKKYNTALQYPKGMSVTQTHQFGSKSLMDSKGQPMYMVKTNIYNDCLHDSLIKAGCVPNKSLVLTFPEESLFVETESITRKQLILHFIRGYFDGDGTLGLYPHSKLNRNLEESLIFVGTKPFLARIQDYLGPGFLMQKRNCGPLTYRLSYSTSKAFKAADLMYKNSTVYLDRKYNIYLKMCHHKSGKNGES